MQSPYAITPLILELVAAISEKIGEAKANHLDRLPRELRESNRIKAIQSTLAMEGHVLSTDQISAIVENKPVNGPAKGITEAKNAVAVYNRLDQFHSTRLSALMRAHKLMMAGLMEAPGKLRSGHHHITDTDMPEAAVLEGKLVKPFLLSLFEYLEKSEDLALIKSCVFHYEIDAIQPFTAGNGRMARLWQTVILREHYSIFGFLAVEEIIWREQIRYFKALNKDDFLGTSTSFIEFMLGAILESLEGLLSGRMPVLGAMDRMEMFRAEITTRSFARLDYLRKYNDISQATASRDLRQGVEKKILKKTGDKHNAVYRFVSV